MMWVVCPRRCLGVIVIGDGVMVCWYFTFMTLGKGWLWCGKEEVEVVWGGGVGGFRGGVGCRLFLGFRWCVV